jgi:hypothetical protein
VPVAVFSCPSSPEELLVKMVDPLLIPGDLGVPGALVVSF